MKNVRLARTNSVFRSLSLCAGLAISLSSSLFAQELDLDSEDVRSGYAIGVNIGMNLLNQGIAEDLDTGALLIGLQDAVNSDLKMSEDEIMAAIQAFSLIQQTKAETAMLEQSQAGADFLAENGLRPEVTTTASGLQYEVMRESFDENAAMPTATQTVNVHYHGTLIDGSVFDSSVERGEPISFPLNGVISGWTEGLQLMRVGSKFRFYIPSELAYGNTGAGTIGPNTMLIFEVELLEIL